MLQFIFIYLFLQIGGIFIIKPFYFDAPFWAREINKMLNLTSELNQKEIVSASAEEKKF